MTIKIKDYLSENHSNLCRHNCKMAAHCLCILALMFCILDVFNCNANANTKKSHCGCSNAKIQIDLNSNIKCKTFTSINNFYNGVFSKELETVSMITLKHTDEVDELYIQNNNDQDYIFTGTFMSSADNQNLISGSFCSNDNRVAVHSVFINKDNLRIVFEDTSKNQVFSIFAPIEKNDLISLFLWGQCNAHFYDVSDEDDTVKSIVLQNITRDTSDANFSILDKQMPLASFQENRTFKSTDSNTGVSVSYSAMKSFFTSINASDSIKPSVSMQNVLSQTGWKFYYHKNKDNDDDRRFFYVLHSTKLDSNENAICITFVRVTKERDSSLRRLTTKIKVADSLCLTYNKSTKKAEVLYYGLGIRLNSPCAAIELVNGTTTFSNYTKTGCMNNQDKPFFNLLTAVSTKLGTASKIWDALTFVNSYQTESDSLDKDDKVRAIAHSANSKYYLLSSNDSIGIYGTYRNTTYSSFRIAFQFKGYSYVS